MSERTLTSEDEKAADRPFTHPLFILLFLLHTVFLFSRINAETLENQPTEPGQAEPRPQRLQEVKA